MEVPPTGELPVQGIGPAPEDPSRWSALAGRLDAFWPVLAVILVAAVIFVASVARSSMDQVGIAGPATAAPTAAPARLLSGTLTIVQVASYPTKAAAQSAARALADREFEIHILKSDDYRPLNSGFYVVYAGPFPNTQAGRAEAKRVQGMLPGSLARIIHSRSTGD